MMYYPAEATPETILVVDDNEGVLQMVSEILTYANYRVLRANSPASAVELSAATAGPIDLLLSDLDMPGMSGPDLGQLLKTTRPDLHVMLMSAGQKGSLLVLNYGWAYLDKPFVMTKLLEMVNNVLQTPDKSQPGGHEYDTRKDMEHK
jgi:DNA-binding NtrC family response regulator